MHLSRFGLATLSASSRDIYFCGSVVRHPVHYTPVLVPLITVPASNLRIDAMDHFSQSSAASACSALSSAAQGTATKIQGLVEVGAVAEDALQKQLSLLAARLRQFRQHVGQLGHCVSDASTVHPQLGDMLKSSLAECQNALESVSTKLVLDTGPGGVGADTVTRSEVFVMAYMRLFALGTQLLIMRVCPEPFAFLFLLTGAQRHRTRAAV